MAAAVPIHNKSRQAEKESLTRDAAARNLNYKRPLSCAVGEREKSCQSRVGKPFDTLFILSFPLPLCGSICIRTCKWAALSDPIRPRPF